MIPFIIPTFPLMFSKPGLKLSFFIFHVSIHSYIEKAIKENATKKCSNWKTISTGFYSVFHGRLVIKSLSCGQSLSILCLSKKNQNIGLSLVLKKQEVRSFI